MSSPRTHGGDVRVRRPAEPHRGVSAKIDVDGEHHLVKLSRYHDNPQLWTVPGIRDERLHRGKKIVTVTEPTPDEYELYDLTLDPLEQRNLAYPRNADDRSRKLQDQMRQLLVEQLAAKRLVPTSGGTPGYRPLADSVRLVTVGS
jgi:hypothetical protein